MDPYARPNEPKVGANRPKISHVDRKIDNRTPQDRQREKQAVVDERRAIKKAARRNLKRQLAHELDNIK
jgi:hypothetical protein